MPPQTQMQIDTLEFSKKLKAAGADERLAEAIVEGLTAADTSNLATKSDIADIHGTMATNEDIGALREEMHREIGLLREETKKEFATLRTEIGKDLAALRSEINARIAYSQLATIVILSAVMGAFRIFG